MERAWHVPGADRYRAQPAWTSAGAGAAGAAARAIAGGHLHQPLEALAADRSDRRRAARNQTSSQARADGRRSWGVVGQAPGQCGRALAWALRAVARGP